MGGRRVSSKKPENKREPQAKTPSPRERLTIRTKERENDWYEAAFKRFSISLNRSSQQKDPLATLMPPVKSGLQ